MTGEEAYWAGLGPEDVEDDLTAKLDAPKVEPDGDQPLGDCHSLAHEFPDGHPCIPSCHSWVKRPVPAPAKSMLHNHVKADPCGEFSCPAFGEQHSDARWPVSAPVPSPTKYPIALTEAQEAEIKSWAADDRLWTTQETVEFNLRTFARKILSVAAPVPEPAKLSCICEQPDYEGQAKLNGGWDRDCPIHGEPAPEAPANADEGEGWQVVIELERLANDWWVGVASETELYNGVRQQAQKLRKYLQGIGARLGLSGSQEAWIKKAAEKIATLQQMGIERGLEFRVHKIEEIIARHAGRDAPKEEIAQLKLELQRVGEGYKFIIIEKEDALRQCRIYELELAKLREQIDGARAILDPEGNEGA